MRYNIYVIQNFKHRGLKRLFERNDKSQVRPDHLETIEDILAFLDIAEKPQDLDKPGYNLHPLKGNLKGFWSVRVSGNWRIVFRFTQGDAFDVDLIDYH